MNNVVDFQILKSKRLNFALGCQLNYIEVVFAILFLCSVTVAHLVCHSPWKAAPYSSNKPKDPAKTKIPSQECLLFSPVVILRNDSTFFYCIMTLK